MGYFDYLFGYEWELIKVACRCTINMHPIDMPEDEKAYSIRL